MPELELMYHIPNGGKRNITTAKRLKAEGVKAGVPDICLPVPRGVYHGLYIELKAGRNITTEKQDEWLEALDSNGYFTAVCYGWEKASKVITNYLKNGGSANV
nr:VRR-NUC domain-containing protein [Ruminiclostridium sufflavum]